jgi:hypothetical protein
MEQDQRIREALLLSKSLLLKEVLQACEEDSVRRWKNSRSIDEREAAYSMLSSQQVFQTALYAVLADLSQPTETLTDE